jgi:dTDP-4-amino-4,6-dideoxygalactose transaminase
VDQPHTFVASANCGLCGAEVDFVDTDPLTYNMSVAALEAKLVQAAAATACPRW